MTPEQHKRERALAIAVQTMHTAGLITSQLKQLPRTGKKGRNILRKTYNRRPQNKQKRVAAFANVAMSVFSGTVQLGIILSRPIPKYKTDVV